MSGSSDELDLQEVEQEILELRRRLKVAEERASALRLAVATTQADAWVVIQDEDGRELVPIRRGVTSPDRRIHVQWFAGVPQLGYSFQTPWGVRETATFFLGESQWVEEAGMFVGFFATKEEALQVVAKTA